MHNDRIRLKSLLDKVISAEEAALFIKNGMTIGMSGFTRSGEAKAVPLALAKRAANEELKITLMTGASLGNDLDKILTQAGVLARRLPFQSDPVLRKAINAGEVMFIDQHLSETVELLRSRQIGPIDIAVAAELRRFSELLTQHELIHEDMRFHFEGFPPNAHPMAILSSMVNAAGCFTRSSWRRRRNKTSATKLPLSSLKFALFPPSPTASRASCRLFTPTRN
jgi:acetyl-CoA hydrolase/transferase-like protein/citrate synthase